MTTTTTAQSPTTTATTGGIWRGLGALCRSELLLQARDGVAVFFLIVFPALLLVGMGFAIPGLRDVITDAPPPVAGTRPLDWMAPAFYTLAIATSALTVLPVVVAGLREHGVLRRLATTPIQPAKVLIAATVSVLVYAGVGLGLAVIAARFALQVDLPSNWFIFVAAYLLGSAGLYGLGLVIGAMAKKAASASGLAMFVYFPSMYLAGVWTPGPGQMPEAVKNIASFTPPGATTDLFNAAVLGTSVSVQPYIVLVAWAVATLALAALVYRRRK